MTFKRVTRGIGVVFFLGCLLFFQQSGIAHAAPASSSGSLQSFGYFGPAGLYTYDVYTPANYPKGTPVPLIVVLSGCTVTASQMAAITGMDVLADQKQFVVAYLQQNPFANPALCWNFFETVNQYRGWDEAGEIAGITQSIEYSSRWTINAHRIYITGISSGAAMAVNMGAAYPDLYAAIGVHSGLEYQAVTAFSLGATITGGPPPVLQGDSAYATMGQYARVVPTIDVQGSADPFVLPINGDQVIQQWMETDHDASGGAYNASFANPSTTTVGQIPGGHSYITYTWNDNNGQEIEEYWVVNGMGHAWSGGQPGQLFSDPEGPSANLAIYTFFMRFSL